MNQYDSSDPELVNIEGVQFAPIIYKGQRVVTFAQVDAFHQRPKGTTKRNFNANRGHFIEGKHYWELTSYEIRTMSAQGLLPARTARAIVLSQAGYLMVATSFTDPLSWRVRSALVDYFEAGHQEPAQEVSVGEMAVMLQDPAFMAKAFGEMIAKAQQLEGQVRELAPKAEFADVVSGAHGSLTVAQAAKVLGYKGPRQLFRWLKENDYLMGNNMPYQHWLNRGLFEVRMTTFNKGDATFNHTQPLITGKGMVHLQQVLGAAQSVALELDANPGGWV